MAKYEPKTLQNLDNPPVVVSTLNYNFDTLKLLLDTFLSRDGATPNTMQSILDMNNNRILNLPVPVSPTEPARHGDIQQYVDQARQYAEDAEELAEEAQQSAEDAQEARDSLYTRYLGEYPVPPSTTPSGAVIAIGAMYFNSTRSQLYVFALDDIHNEGDPVFAGGSPVVIGYWVPLPVSVFSLLNDVDLTGASNGDFLLWTGTQVVSVSPVADVIEQDNPIYTGTSVQDALDDLINRTSLGIYDVYIYAQGLPGNSEQIARLITTRTFTLPVNAGMSRASLRVAPSLSNAVFSIQRNGVSVGTVTFAIGSTSGVFSVTGDNTFQTGDILSVVAPATVDIAIRDLSLTLACVR